MTAPASLSLCHHGRPSDLAWFLTAFHQRESLSLSSREVSLVLRLKSLWPIVSSHSCHKRESRSWIQSAAAAAAECGMPIQDAVLLPVSSVSDSEVGCNQEEGRDLPVCCSSLPPAVGKSVCLGWLLLESLFFISFPLGSSPEFWDICHSDTAREESGLLLFHFSLFPRPVLW